jgi:hypothetical protein
MTTMPCCLFLKIFRDLNEEGMQRDLHNWKMEMQILLKCKLYACNDDEHSFI